MKTHSILHFRLNLGKLLLLAALFSACLGRAESPHAALLAACRTGELDLAAQALRVGANPSYEQQEPAGLATPLGVALEHGHHEVAALLIAQGAEIWPSLNNLHRMPGCLAVKWNSPHVATMLAKLPPRPTEPMLEALAENLATQGRGDALKQLANFGLRPEHVTKAGGTSFLWALGQNHLAVATDLFAWSAPRLLKRFDKNLDVSILIRGLAQQPWQEASVVALVEEMFTVGVRFIVPPDSEETTPGAMANRYRLPLLAARLGWTGATAAAWTAADHAVLAVLLPQPDQWKQFYMIATSQQPGSEATLASRILANSFASKLPFQAQNANRWLAVGADLNAVVDLPYAGRMTAAGCALKAEISDQERAARFQWLREKGANLFQNLKLTDKTSLSAVKALFSWGGQPTPAEKEQLLAHLILWHGAERQWESPLRGLLRYLVDQKATLGKSPAAVEALSILARRPEPSLLWQVDEFKQQRETMENFRASPQTKFSGSFQTIAPAVPMLITFQPNGQVIIETETGSTNAVWQEAENQTAHVKTPTRTHFLRISPQGNLEVRSSRHRHRPEVDLVPLVEYPQAASMSPDQAPAAFRSRGLTELPAQDAAWENTPAFDCSDNRLQHLPSQLLSQPTLVSLTASRNWLSDLEMPVKLPLLTNLELAGNGFDHLLPWLSRCPNLQQLNLADNRLAQFPKHLSQLSNLTSLDLSGNRLDRVPTDLVRKIPSLKILKLARNRLTELPPEILQSQLEELDVSHNAIDFATLSGALRVRRMDIRGNNFTDSQLESLVRRYPETVWIHHRLTQAETAMK